MGIKEVIILLLTTVLGFAVSYFKAKTNIKTLAAKWILFAEEQYRGYTKAGNEKFQLVVNKIHNCIPSILKFIFTKKVIAELVQNTFNAMQAYAQEQLDKQIDNKLKKLDNQ